jgi:hypothetical protein
MFFNPAESENPANFVRETDSDMLGAGFEFHLSEIFLRWFYA